MHDNAQSEMKIARTLIIRVPVFVNGFKKINTRCNFQ